MHQHRRGHFGWHGTGYGHWLSRLLKGGYFTWLHNISQQCSDRNGFSKDICAWRNAEDTRFKRFDFVERFIGFNNKHKVAGLNRVPILLEPFHQRPLFHRPAEAWHDNFNSHIVSLFCQQITDSLLDLIGVWNYGSFQRRTVGCRGMDSV